MGISQKLRSALKRVDDWYSTAIGLGGVSDKVASVAFRHGSAVDDDELDALYHRDGIAARVVDAIPSEAMREGYRVVIEADVEEEHEHEDALDLPPALVGTENGPGPGSEQEPPRLGVQSLNPQSPKLVAESRLRARTERSRATSAKNLSRSAALKAAAETSKQIVAYARGIYANDRILETWTWGRLFGGGVLLVGADDGQPLDEPLDENRIATIRYLHSVDRRYISILRYVADPLATDFGEPELYAISSDKPGTTTTPLRTVHASRCIVFGGVRTTAWQRALRYGWDAPVLERVYDQLRRYNANLGAVSQLVMDASQGVLRIKDLPGIIAAGDGAALQERIEIMDRTRSVMRSILLDMDEDFHREPTSFAGLEDVIRQSEMDLAAALGWPVTFLFGRAPAGLNATGESDYRTITDLIRGEQMNVLRPRVQRLVHLILCAKDGPTGGVPPEKWDVVFNPLRQSTPAESAEIRKATAEADRFWLELGVPKESILRSHFRPDGFVADLELDVEAVLAEMEERDAEKHEGEAMDAEAEEGMAAMKAAKDEQMAAAMKAESDEQQRLEREESRSIMERMRARQAAK